MCNAKIEEGIGIICTTGHTPFQYSNAFCYEIFWLVWNCSMIKMIWKYVAWVLFFDFLVRKLSWLKRIYTNVWLCCVKYFNPIDHKRPNGLHTYHSRHKIWPVQCSTMAQHARDSNIIKRGFHSQNQSYSILNTPGGVCSRPCTTNHFSIRSLHNQPPCTQRRCMNLHFKY